MLVDRAGTIGVAPFRNTLPQSAAEAQAAGIPLESLYHSRACGLIRQKKGWKGVWGWGASEDKYDVYEGNK
jgi:hypothetical protein